MGILGFMAFKREITGYSRNQAEVTRALLAELDDLMKRWKIDQYDTEQEENTIHIRSSRFNGKFQATPGGLLVEGKFGLRVALQQKELHRSFDTWISRVFRTSPDF